MKKKILSNGDELKKLRNQAIKFKKIIQIVVHKLKRFDKLID